MTSRSSRRSISSSRSQLFGLPLQRYVATVLLVVLLAGPCRSDAGGGGAGQRQSPAGPAGDESPHAASPQLNLSTSRKGAGLHEMQDSLPPSLLLLPPLAPPLEAAEAQVEVETMSKTRQASSSSSSPPEVLSSSSEVPSSASSSSSELRGNASNLDENQGTDFALSHGVSSRAGMLLLPPPPFPPPPPPPPGPASPSDAGVAVDGDNDSNDNSNNNNNSTDAGTPGTTAGGPDSRRVSCAAPLVPHNRLVILNATEVTETLSANRNECSLLIFYSPHCMFSVRSAPYLNGIARYYPNISVLALQINESTSVNMKYGIVAIPTVLLLHNARAIAKLNHTNATSLEALADFIEKHTGLGRPTVPDAAAAAAAGTPGTPGAAIINMTLHDIDFVGPLPCVKVDRPNWLLPIAWIFTVLACFYLLLRTSYAGKAYNWLVTSWREAREAEQAQRPHQD